jgi:hypothetical protein
MNIKINNSNAAQSCLDQNKALWHLLIKDHLKRLLVPLIVSLSLIAFGLYDFNESGIVVTMGKITHYNFHLFLSIGIVLLVIVLLTLIKLIKEKSMFFQKVNRLALGHSQNSNTITIDLTENSVKFQSHELTREMKWTVFSNYKVYKNYVILLVESYIVGPIVIDKRLISENEYSELINFIKTKLTEKNQSIWLS